MRTTCKDDSRKKNWDGGANGVQVLWVVKITDQIIKLILEFYDIQNLIIDMKLKNIT